MFRHVSVAVIFVLGASVIFAEPPDHHSEDPEMLGTMMQPQHLSHKLQLSLDKGNQALASFYADEIGGAMQGLYEIESYGGYPVGDLAKSTLGPVFKALAGALERKDTALSRKKSDQFLDACNSCHTITEHGYIKIAPNPVNPYLQSFEPR